MKEITKESALDILGGAEGSIHILFEYEERWSALIHNRMVLILSDGEGYFIADEDAGFAQMISFMNGGE